MWDYDSVTLPNHSYSSLMTEDFIVRTDSPPSVPFRCTFQLQVHLIFIKTKRRSDLSRYLGKLTPVFQMNVSFPPLHGYMWPALAN